jgi:uncharacterized membrane protein YgaE (UPF0421/DUF939 family)
MSFCNSNSIKDLITLVALNISQNTLLAYSNMKINAATYNPFYTHYSKQITAHWEINRKELKSTDPELYPCHYL